MPVKVAHADRWPRICRILGTSCNPTALGPLSRGLQRSQGGSQNMLLRPRTIKNGLQPKRAISRPPARVPSAGPHFVPASINALATPLLGEMTSEDLGVTGISYGLSDSQ